MPILKQSQLDRIRQIIRRSYSMIILRVLGPEALSAEERELVGVPVEEVPTLKAAHAAYQYGLWKGRDGRTHDNPTFEQFVDAASHEDAPLSAVEESAVQNAERHAGVHIRHLGARTEQQFGTLLYTEEMRARDLLVGDVQQQTSQAIQNRQSIQQLKKNLQDLRPTWDRDWNRVAITEKTNALQAGTADRIRRDHGDESWVYKQPMPDACPHCLRLHVGPDGHPRIFRLAMLQQNGTNVGRKAAEWLPVVGVVHPHCQCQLVRVPAGWGFDEDSVLVPGGTGGIRYHENEDLPGPHKVLERSLGSEACATDSMMGNRAVSPTAGGVNFVVGTTPSHLSHRTNATQIRDLKDWLASFGDVDRGALVLRDPDSYLINVDPPPALVHHYDQVPLHADPTDDPDVEAQKTRMERQTAVRLRTSIPNLLIKGLPDQRPIWEIAADLTNQVPARDWANVPSFHVLEKAAGPFIGPRGGKWADPKFTISWKPPIQRTPILPSVEAHTAWKEGHPPHIPAPNWASWEVGKRGGTEQLYCDPETKQYRPDRATLHGQIIHDASAHVPKSDSKTAILSMGGPASGKSYMLDHHADLPHYVTINADLIKERLPEFQDAVHARYRGAAEVVHAESATIAERLLHHATDNGQDLIFDSTGADFPRLEGQLRRLTNNDYHIALIMPHVGVETALRLARKRAEATGRWVPEEATRDAYRKVCGSFVQALQYSPTALLYNNEVFPPSLIFSKHGATMTIHDPEKAKDFPGLSDLISKADSRPDMLAVLQTIANKARKPKSELISDSLYGCPDWISVLPLDEDLTT